MTCQYLIGELSVRLQQLQATVGPAVAPAVMRLRADVEASSLAGLGSVSARAVALADELCWESLSRGDVAVFDAQARILGDLSELAAATRLLSGC